MNVLDIVKIALIKVAAFVAIVAAFTKIHHQLMMMID